MFHKNLFKIQVNRVESREERQNLLRRFRFSFLKPCCVMRIVLRLRSFRRGPEDSLVL